MSGRPKLCVSGTSRGLGQALAMSLSEEYDIVGFARSGWPGVDEKGVGRILHLEGIDASRLPDLDRLEEHLGDCDGLVNNLGMARDGLLATQPFQDVKDVIAVNLTSVLYLTRLYLRARIKRRRGGSIVLISSIVGIRGYSGLAAYSATKGALNAMTRSLAREMGPKGFRVNVVLPGFMDTEMTAGLTEQKKAKIVGRTPLGRLAACEDVVAAVRFLLSDGARSITGQELVVDGGISC